MEVIPSFDKKEYAAAYATYRPKYPLDIKTTIMNYATQESYKRDVILDVACASGQATLMWAEDFNTVYGIDISQTHLNQIESTPQNVTFAVGNAENLNFANNSIDLITIAQGLRWVDVEKFYAEVKRVLKPGGVLAAFGHHYNDMSLDKIQANIALYEFDRDVFKKHDCWLPGARLEDNDYQDFVLPLRDFQRLTKYEKIISWSVRDIIGLIRTTSAAQVYAGKCPHSDVFLQLEDRLVDIYQTDTPIVTLPIFILLGRK